MNPREVGNSYKTTRNKAYLNLLTTYVENFPDDVTGLVALAKVTYDPELDIRDDKKAFELLNRADKLNNGAQNFDLYELLIQFYSKGIGVEQQGEKAKSMALSAMKNTLYSLEQREFFAKQLEPLITLHPSDHEWNQLGVFYPG